jgi:hypothetical protein
MSDGFVGFRPLVKTPRGAKPRKYKLEARSECDVAEVYTTLTSREGIDSLLDETVRFDARHGGKLRFISKGDDGYGGTYSLLQVGKRVIILTEHHGELDFRLKSSAGATVVSIRASKLLRDDEVGHWHASIDTIASTLGGGK